jgi:hypothetical protein
LLTEDLSSEVGVGLRLRRERVEQRLIRYRLALGLEAMEGVSVLFRVVENFNLFAAGLPATTA